MGFWSAPERGSECYCPGNGWRINSGHVNSFLSLQRQIKPVFHPFPAACSLFLTATLIELWTTVC